MASGTEPKTLQDAIIYFADKDNCREYLMARRWPDSVVACPTCGSDKVSFVVSRGLWQCRTRHPKAQFSIKVGTIFEDSPITLDKWLLAMWMLANCKNGVSSYEISRATGISQKSTWFMLQRIRLALQDKNSGGTLGGDVEIDETYIGGKARNMHKDVRARRVEHERGSSGKAVVLGMLERRGKVRARVVKNNRRSELKPHIVEHVQSGSTVFTDSHPSYLGMPQYEHQVIDHAVSYVEGNVHTNGLENFWSLLKRGISGTYVSIEPFHLFRYVDEQAFRFNNRKDNDGEPLTDSDRFDLAVRQIIGKRLTWDEVTGKTASERLN